MIGKKKKKNAENETWETWRDIVDAIFKSTEKDREKMTNYLNQFRGDIWDTKKIEEAGESDKYKSKAYINMLFSTIEQIAPMLTDSKPIANVIPRLPYYEKLAWKYNKATEYLWDTQEMQTEIYKMALMAMIMKKGIMKIYFDPDKAFGGDIGVEVIDTRDFFIAPGYSDEWKAPYCGVKTPKDLCWIRKRFPDAEKVEAETSIFETDQKQKAFKYGESSDEELSARFADVYEIWVKDDDTEVEIINEQGEKEKDEEGKVKKTKKYPYGKFVYFTKDVYLGTEPAEYFHGLPPYVSLDNYLDPLNFLGIGEIDHIDGLNKELNLQFAYWMNYSRMYHDPNHTYDVNQVIDADQVKDTFHKGGQFYAVDRSMGSTAPLIEPINTPGMDASIPNLFMLIPQLIENINGVTEVSKGSVSKKERQSASELAMLLESSHTRTRQRVRNLEKTIKRINYLFVQLMQQYYTEPRTTYTKDTEGNVLYQTIGNSAAQMQRAVAPDLNNPPAGAELNPQERSRQLPPEEQKRIQEWEREKNDFEHIMEAINGGGEYDPVYFAFDISVQTNSTLPMDKQSLSNLMIRLYEMKAIDAQALLEILQIPHREEILERMAKMRAMAMKAKGAK